ncbi:MAG: isochorismate synthase [Ignavibacteria bacterium]|nr:isochorismate synthase [Ignavibacteria bacterium]
MADDILNTHGSEPLIVETLDGLPRVSPLTIYTRLLDEGAHHATLWRSPEGEIFVAAGAAAERHGAGDGASWREVFGREAASLRASMATRMQGAAPPVFFTLFFNPGRAEHPGWEGFSPLSLVVPALLFSIRPDGMSRTVTCRAEERAGWIALAERLAAEDIAVDEPAMDPLAARMNWNEAPFIGAVEHAIRLLHRGAPEKLVLARALEITAERDIRIPLLLRALDHAYPECFLFVQAPAPGALFLSATPERLARVRDRDISTAAVAGSVPTGRTLGDEQKNRADLQSNAKYAKEHSVVARMIHDVLEELCDEVVTGHTEVLILRNVQHLVTPFTGTLSEGRGIVDAVARLHPTPAVCGSPREQALDIIERYEQFDRGQYAGVAGWMDADGNGDAAVTIRSAVFHGRDALLFGGAGLVAESVARDEVEETRVKLQAILSALAQA